MQRLDSHLLRTFLAVAESGSVTAGAARIHRSQSATSLQIRQLEEAVGQPVFLRSRRGIALTRAGQHLLSVARQVVGTLDQATSELRQDGLAGRLRIGIPEDQAETALPLVVADFARAHPRVELVVHCGSGDDFGRRLIEGELDMAVHELPSVPEGAVLLRSLRAIWAGSPRHCLASLDPLPVALFNRECWWRDAALSDLRASGRAHRLVFTSESSAGVRAAVSAGVAVGLLSETSRGEEFVPLPQIASPRESHLILQFAPGFGGAACEAMCHAVREAFRALDA